MGIKVGPSPSKNLSIQLLKLHKLLIPQITSSSEKVRHIHMYAYVTKIRNMNA